ncbi:uncharacterized protein [Vicugna pacos]|uniref:DUF1725 domain-containing protein n=1 Tax=Vicugna pacos TaxID=30538 RepID=A0ABM5EC57_VICPA
MYDPDLHPGDVSIPFLGLACCTFPRNQHRAGEQQEKATQNPTPHPSLPSLLTPGLPPPGPCGRGSAPRACGRWAGAGCPWTSSRRRNVAGGLGRCFLSLLLPSPGRSRLTGRSALQAEELQLPPAPPARALSLGQLTAHPAHAQDPCLVAVTMVIRAGQPCPRGEPQPELPLCGPAEVGQVWKPGRLSPPRAMEAGQEPGSPGPATQGGTWPGVWAATFCRLCCLHQAEGTLLQDDICTPVFTAALFTIAKTWKQPKCPSTDDWIKKMWYIYTMEYYSAIKTNNITPFAATWMFLENFILSEVSQKEKEKYHMRSLICGI